jgi:hypothetical protein
MSRDEIPAALSQLRTGAVALGVLGVVGLLLSYFTSPEVFFRSYLYGYMFALSFPLGCMGLLFLHHLVGGAWGFIIQRILEAGVQSIWLMAVLFVPVALGGEYLYLWMDPEVVAHDVILQGKVPYLNYGFWLVRAAVYFAIWLGLAAMLIRYSKKQDETGEGAWSNRLNRISGIGMVIYFLTMTFASFDWAMSLEPHWFSTIYGLIFVEGQGLTALAFAIVVLSVARRNATLGRVATVDRIHDIGKIQFALIALWAYLNFSQFLIIWYANLPEEITWYAHRTQGGYEYLAAFLVFGQFLLPFFLLMTRMTKRRMQTLAGIAGYILVVRLVDLYWLLMPTEHHLELKLHFGHVAAPLGLFGIWFVVFYWNLSRRSILVEQDPRWKEKLAHEHAH